MRPRCRKSREDNLINDEQEKLYKQTCDVTSSSDSTGTKASRFSINDDGGDTFSLFFAKIEKNLESVFVSVFLFLSSIFKIQNVELFRRFCDETHQRNALWCC